MSQRYVYNVHKNCIETSNGEFVVYVNSVDGVRIARKLNELADENEQLRFDFKEFKSLLHSLEEENEQLKTIKNQYKGQRDYLLFVIERVCSKEKYEETKGYLKEVVDEYD